MLLDNKLFLRYFERVITYCKNDTKYHGAREDIFAHTSIRSLTTRITRAKILIHSLLSYIMLIMLHHSDIISLSNISLDN